MAMSAQPDFCHACVLIEWHGVSILPDPFIPEQGEIERFTFKNLPPRIDYVLITHGHHDHFVFESLHTGSGRSSCRGAPLCQGEV